MKYTDIEDVQYSSKWSLFFETKDKKCHPIRLAWKKPVSQHVAEQEAKKYLNENKSWLSKVDFISSTE